MGRENANYVAISLALLWYPITAYLLKDNTFVDVFQIIQLRRDPKGDDKRIRATLRKPSSRYSDEEDHFQHKVRLAAEENRRLRGFLEQVWIPLNIFAHFRSFDSVVE